MRDDIKINTRAAAISHKLVEKLQTVYDPEIELDVYNLGLIYEIDLDEKGHCHLVITFTEASCTCVETLPAELVKVLGEIEEISSVTVEVVWKPVWKMTRISRLGRITLGISPR
ncbi:metal-sulfur cluster assembly factor [Streptococcus sp. zg-JUN1979]|uniref:metal-sulfur cluster assembly factor n=1 Tax=Streptococcus sp. zg-JUN1979 TaxID=3391450 RepID=UPI0039A5C35A